MTESAILLILTAIAFVGPICIMLTTAESSVRTHGHASVLWTARLPTMPLVQTTDRCTNNYTKVGVKKAQTA